MHEHALTHGHAMITTPVQQYSHAAHAARVSGGPSQLIMHIDGTMDQSEQHLVRSLSGKL